MIKTPELDKRLAFAAVLDINARNHFKGLGSRLDPLHFNIFAGYRIRAGDTVDFIPLVHDQYIAQIKNLALLFLFFRRYKADRNNH